ncbi:endocellulase [Collybia nuda]|uniref:Endocellulase n=1 Tax=Collybia nuda TaxID=64659 RepID=A0A9P6CPS5_9AGAR|nr:endocellulase [Collybia nuda]
MDWARVICIGILWLCIKAVFAQSISGEGECLPAGKFTLCQNLWAADVGVGSQTSTILKVEGRSTSWSTQYTWSQNPNQVKSFANVISDVAKGMQVVDIVSAPTSWTWAYTSKSPDTRANIAYDIWTGILPAGNPASSASSYELMVWLAGMDKVQPLGVVVTSNISLAGYTWNLWKGAHKTWQVLSFVSAEGELSAFNADLNEFLTFLVENQGFNSSQYIQAIQAGTEPFTGAATLVTSKYTLEISKKIVTPVQSSGAQKILPFWHRIVVRLS